MNTLRFFAASLRRDFVSGSSYRTAFLGPFIGIAVISFLYLHLSRIIDSADPRFLAQFGGRYFPYFIIGMGIHQFTQLGMISFVRQCRAEAVSGTLEALWLGRQSPLALIVSMGLPPFLLGLIRLAGLLVVGGFFMPALFGKISIPEFFLSVTLAFWVYASIGLGVVSVMLMTKRGEQIAQFFGTLNFILAGVIIPVSLLPSFLQGVSEFLPLTHLLRLGRAGITGFETSSLLALILFASAVYPAAWLLLKRAVRRVRLDGSLTHF